jgi:hypothetical protein
VRKTTASACQPGPDNVSSWLAKFNSTGKAAWADSQTSTKPHKPSHQTTIKDHRLATLTLLVMFGQGFLKKHDLKSCADKDLKKSRINRIPVGIFQKKRIITTNKLIIDTTKNHE